VWGPDISCHGPSNIRPTATADQVHQDNHRPIGEAGGDHHPAPSGRRLLLPDREHDAARQSSKSSPWTKCCEPAMTSSTSSCERTWGLYIQRCTPGHRQRYGLGLQLAISPRPAAMG
jgi:hypothetical protein